MFITLCLKRYKNMYKKKMEIIRCKKKKLVTLFSYDSKIH